MGKKRKEPVDCDICGGSLNPTDLKQNQSSFKIGGKIIRINLSWHYAKQYICKSCSREALINIKMNFENIYDMENKNAESK